MRLTFLGTRAYIDIAKRGHQRHSAAMLEHRGARVMIDCGEDWRGRVCDLKPDAIILTHAHPDHAFGLKDGAPCPVYATQVTWDYIDDFPIAERRTVTERRPVEFRGIVFEAFGVEHSTRCPAVGYRITTGGEVLFYVPDVAYIHERAAALDDVALYVGDGATLERPLIRKADDHLVGHAPVRQQLTWCATEGVPSAIFTHCGKDVVGHDGRKVAGTLRALANARGVSARFAHDGMEVDLD
ncbi:MBL fold metallo-hydrolase [Ferruginivarius sediminum]|uniref:MBL fold metallo-hydrolase n=1 Tax=Ferruginivarius sediminum TaxID=2661937 RepID=A0A369TGE2_9PROT|nr:MBL fold metallo-hydrolase [Ferruginivarius sediminum]RDD63197.1 MBL fold metallo-hydrolase [Ferruginivarius sediminum]